MMADANFDTGVDILLRVLDPIHSIPWYLSIFIWDKMRLSSDDAENTGLTASSGGQEKAKL
jgi:hypothetical protein